MSCGVPNVFALSEVHRYARTHARTAAEGGTGGWDMKKNKYSKNAPTLQ